MHIVKSYIVNISLVKFCVSLLELLSKDLKKRRNANNFTVKDNLDTNRTSSILTKARRKREGGFL